MYDIWIHVYNTRNLFIDFVKKKLEEEGVIR